MADIWLATDERQKPYALRRMHQRLRFNLLARRRFVRGCEILSKISDHDGIIGYVEHGKIEGQLYLLMEYVEASNLKELYARHDPVLLENVAQILIDMAAGPRAHARERLHAPGFQAGERPRHPQRRRAPGGFRPRPADSGEAQESARRRIPARPPTWPRNNCSASRSPIAWTSSPSAWPPMNCSPTRSRSRATLPAEILKRQLDRSSFVPPRQHNPDVPPAMEKVILRCLERDPGRRYPFVGVMAREIQAALYV